MKHLKTYENNTFDGELFKYLKNKFRGSVYKIVYEDEDEDFISIIDTSLPEIDKNGCSNTLIDFDSENFNISEVEEAIEHTTEWVNNPTKNDEATEIDEETVKIYSYFLKFITPIFNFYKEINNYNL